MNSAGKNMGAGLAELNLKFILADASEFDRTYLVETLGLITTLSELENKITTRQPYQEIQKAKISDYARRKLLQFNALYQTATELLESKCDLADFPMLELTKIQSEMPREYVAKCILFELILMYAATDKHSAEKDLNRRLIGGFFSRLAGGRLPDSLEEKAKTIILPEEYKAHFDRFARAKNEILGSYIFGSIMGASAHLEQK